jgi:hypothetical protein
LTLAGFFVDSGALSAKFAQMKEILELSPSILAKKEKVGRCVPLDPDYEGSVVITGYPPPPQRHSSIPARGGGANLQVSL